jgi:hypothetical protein
MASKMFFSSKNYKNDNFSKIFFEQKGFLKILNGGQFKKSIFINFLFKKKLA